MTTISTKQDLILDFIKQFRDLGATNCFSNGMCYWFADILHRRFMDEHCHLMYDEIENHFGCEINSRVYDITGDVTGSYNWESWYTLAVRDRKLQDRIIRDCRDKIPADVLVGGYCPHGHYDEWQTLICDKDNHPCGWNELCIFEEENLPKELDNVIHIGPNDRLPENMSVGTVVIQHYDDNYINKTKLREDT